MSVVRIFIVAWFALLAGGRASAAPDPGCPECPEPMELVWCHDTQGDFDYMIPVPPHTGNTMVVDDDGTLRDYGNIGLALADAVDGDRIYVCPGDYYERVTIDMDIELIGVMGADVTFIRWDFGQPVITVKASSVIRGFTIHGADYNETCYYGGAIQISGSEGHPFTTQLIEFNKIVDNEACKAAGIFVGGASTGSWSTFVSGIIRNNVIARNHSATTNAAGVVVNCDRATNFSVINNVVAQNTVPLSSVASGLPTGGIEFVGISCTGVEARNNIAFENIGHGIAGRPGSIFEFNDSFANGSDAVPGLGNIIVDPMFADPVNFWLLPSSMCIDAGDPLPAYDDVDGTTNDMGAYGGGSATGCGRDQTRVQSTRRARPELTASRSAPGVPPGPSWRSA